MRLYERFARLILLVVLSALPQSAVAAPITVGDGTAASCTEVALQDALTAAGTAGGGTIRFECGDHPVSVTLTTTLTVPNDTRIDGRGVITLDGTHTVRVVFVDRDTSVVLKDLSISNGTPAMGPELSGGGVYNKGTLTVYNSTFSGNHAGDLSPGGGIANEGTLTVHNSTFSGNGSLDAGGGIVNKGTVTVHNSIFSGNSAGFGGSGGGIFNEGTLTVHNSTFSSNVSEAGGGILNAGTLSINNSLIAGNTAVGSSDGEGLGGGIYNTATLTVNNSTITRNIAGQDGGGIYTCCGGTVTFKNTSVTGNTPNDIVP